MGKQPNHKGALNGAARSSACALAAVLAASLTPSLAAADPPATPAAAKTLAWPFIRRFEGVSLHAYVDPVGVLTISAGVTAESGCIQELTPDSVLSEDAEQEVFDCALEATLREVTPLLRRAPSAQQLAAMVSMAYNIGAARFSRSSVLAKFNAGDDVGAGDAFLHYTRARNVQLPGLVNRRGAERALYLSQGAASTAADR